MNPFRRFLDFISYPSHSRTIGFLAFLVVLLAVPLTVNIAQKQQELRQRAAGVCDPSDPSSGWTYVSCTTPDGQPGHKASCGGNTDPTCYPGATGGSSNTSGSAGSGGTANTCTGSCLWNNVQACEQAEGFGKCTIIPGQTCGGGKTCLRIIGRGPDSPTPPTGAKCIPFNGDTTDCTIYTGPNNCLQGQNAYVCKDPAIVACEAIGGTCLDNGKCILGPNSYAAVTCPPIKTGGACVPSQAAKCTPACGTPQTCGKSTTCTDNCGNTYTGQCDACSTVPGSTVAAPPTAGSGTTCDASKGFIASCKFGSDPSTKDNSTQCTQANGQPGKSVMECQSSNCWYDSYYDTSATKAPKTQWCYPLGSGTQITFVVGLDGIGQTGDQKNPNPQPISNQSRGSNQSPKRTQRTFFYQVFDASGTTEQANGQGTIGYDSAKGKFTAGATLNKTLADGTYLLKVRVQGFLAKIVRGVTISGGVAQVPSTNLVNGDTNGNNELDALDYGLILQCAFKSLLTDTCKPADLDDNGRVDQFDYNLLIREWDALSSVRGKGE